jgi:hypothetical protein
MHSAEGMQLNAGVITSSPGPMPNALRIIKRESVPLPVPMQCLTLNSVENSCSNFFTGAPPMNWAVCKNFFYRLIDLLIESIRTGAGDQQRESLLFVFKHRMKIAQQRCDFVIANFVNGLNGWPCFPESKSIDLLKCADSFLCADQ